MIKLLVAFSNNRVIGLKNQLVWHLPNDLKRFKKFTTGQLIIMGRKTFQSIGRPLPNRETVVISRNSELIFEGVKQVSSLQEAVDYAKSSFPEKEIYIVGGEQIYRMAMDLVDQLEITLIHQDFEGDAFFPEIDLNSWIEIKREKGIIDDNNQLEHSFITYERKK